MSECGFVWGVKCPQNYVEVILQNQQPFLILPDFHPQIKLLSLIPQHLPLKLSKSQHKSIFVSYMCDFWTKMSSILKEMSTRTACATCSFFQLWGRVPLNLNSVFINNCLCINTNKTSRILQTSKPQGLRTSKTNLVPMQSHSLQFQFYNSPPPPPILKFLLKLQPMII